MHTFLRVRKQRSCALYIKNLKADWSPAGELFKALDNRWSLCTKGWTRLFFHQFAIDFMKIKKNTDVVFLLLAQNTLEKMFVNGGIYASSNCDEAAYEAVCKSMSHKQYFRKVLAWFQSSQDDIISFLPWNPTVTKRKSFALLRALNIHF